MSIEKQSEIMNSAHGVESICRIVGKGIDKCLLQRWKSFLPEYDTPKLEYPMIALKISGRAKIRRVIDNKVLSRDYVMPGDIAILPRMEDTRWRINGNVDVAVLIFKNSATCDRLQELHDNMKNKMADLSYISIFTNSYIFSTANHLLNIAKYLTDDGKYDNYIDAVFRTLEMYILNFLGKDDEELNSTRSDFSSLVAYTVERLDLGVKVKVTIEDIASEVGVAAPVLIRKFKNEVGITPHSYLLLSRIKKARKLLADTDIDIATVAEESGFSHQSHLTRIFTKEIGMSPGKFRKHVENARK